MKRRKEVALPDAFPGGIERCCLASEIYYVCSRVAIKSINEKSKPDNKFWYSELLGCIIFSVLYSLRAFVLACVYVYVHRYSRRAMYPSRCCRTPVQSMMRLCFIIFVALSGLTHDRVARSPSSSGWSNESL